ncbi:hypothetical protein NKG94_14880 [Micromonospora sp. M12]
MHRRVNAYDPVQVFVSPSEFLADVMRRAGVYPDRLRVVNHFVDLTGVAAKETPGGGVVFAGRLAPEKGVDVLVEAVAALPDGVTVDVAGDGPARPGWRRSPRGGCPAASGSTVASTRHACTS